MCEHETAGCPSMCPLTGKLDYYGDAGLVSPRPTKLKDRDSASNPVDYNACPFRHGRRLAWGDGSDRIG